MMGMDCCVQVGEGIIYVAAGSNPGHFGIQLANALQVLEQLPNPLVLIYDYVLQIGGALHQSGLFIIAQTAPVSVSTVNVR